jgi:hypothetical protein
MANELQFGIYCWFWQRLDDKRHVNKVSLEKAFEIITVDHRYFDFYFSKTKPNLKTNIYNEQLYVEDDQWRRQELIQLSSPTVMAFGQGQKGLLFNIHFGNQYIDKGVVIDKSEIFQNLTNTMTKWFKDNFVELRGKDCFDNLEEHERIFGTKYGKKKASSQQ